MICCTRLSAVRAAVVDKAASGPAGWRALRPKIVEALNTEFPWGRDRSSTRNGSPRLAAGQGLTGRDDLQPSILAGSP